MKSKEQTRKLAVGCSKYSFEVADKTDEVSSKHCFEVVVVQNSVLRLQMETDEVRSKHCFEVVDGSKQCFEVADGD
ncbi:chlorohydrolase [Streptococcus pneumoniae]|nr:chlorohydrolase [Streptococcus pneumoniae]